MSIEPTPGTSRASRLTFRIWDLWTWWRHTAWFQWAHAPLCSRFQHDVWNVRGWRICRSCTLVYSAMAITLAVVLGLSVSTAVRIASGYGLLLPLLAGSYPTLYTHFPRWVKDVLRFGAGVCLMSIATLLTTPYWGLAAGTFAILYAVFVVFRAARRRVKATECEGCPELGQSCVCSGYTLQAESVRVYQLRIEDELNTP